MAGTHTAAALLLGVLLAWTAVVALPTTGAAMLAPAADSSCIAGCFKDLSSTPEQTAPGVVCGEDGVTYYSKCLAECQGIAVTWPGPCTPGADAAFRSLGGDDGPSGPHTGAGDGPPSSLALAASAEQVVRTLERLSLEGFRWVRGSRCGGRPHCWRQHSPAHLGAWSRHVWLCWSLQRLAASLDATIRVPLASPRRMRAGTSARGRWQQAGSPQQRPW